MVYCSVDECLETATHGSLCDLHAKRKARGGDMNRRSINLRSTLEEVLAFSRECARLGLEVGVRLRTEFGRPPPTPLETFEEQLQAAKRRRARGG